MEEKSATLPGVTPGCTHPGQILDEQMAPAQLAGDGEADGVLLAKDDAAGLGDDLIEKGVHGLNLCRDGFSGREAIQG
jgi:hypothetical protein